MKKFFKLCAITLVLIPAAFYITFYSKGDYNAITLAIIFSLVGLLTDIVAYLKDSAFAYLATAILFSITVALIPATTLSLMSIIAAILAFSATAITTIKALDIYRIKYYNILT